ncbi:patatin-like phospholipase family protein [Proteiniborus sp. MB09-C3]|uniref:patatin-like phospholipase family protein n=1 Tax=Proteiniborus sp. MB09-C3 TaxID=3050072 RepID=UPI002556C047|nr:patatin-like phospholipase family protein [Proteiniborus sp. MB09-C3]WIV11923.1 patatin-like phospholipase family protein [Proteiniborus sp. MB09-C3]
MLGLVLEGGGAKGSYEIGACMALKELGIEIDGVVGTSIGAINGAMIVQGDLEKAYELWYDITPSDVLDVNDRDFKKIMNMDIKTKDVPRLAGKLIKIIKNKGFDTQNIRNLLDENIDEKKLRQSNMDFGIVTVSLTDKKPMELFKEDIPEGKITDYIMASAYHPAFKLEKVDGKLFIDGSFFDNLPIKLLYEKGYRNIIAIRLYAVGRVRKVKEKDLEVTYIEPSEKLCHTLDFTNRGARRNLQLGYYDTIKIFKNLKGRKYYLEPKNDEEFFLNYLLDIGERKVLRIGSILGIENIPYRRMLLEFIIPRLIELLKLDKDISYEDLVIALVEEIAKKCELEKFKMYKYDEFYTRAIDNYEIFKRKPRNKIPKFIKQNEILSKAAKEPIIDEIVFEIFR